MHAYIALLCRLALGMMWTIAGFAKLAQKEPRGEAVAHLAMLPRPAAQVVGAVLPYLEGMLGLFLLFGQWTAAAAIASAALLVVFSLAISINLIRGRKVECHCFGELGRAPISWLSVVRNAVLLAAALGVAFSRTEYLALDGYWKGVALRPADPPPAGLAPVLLLALAALAAGMMAVERREVAAAARRMEIAGAEARAAAMTKEEAHA